jgi:hypothetical protein
VRQRSRPWRKPWVNCKAALVEAGGGPPDKTPFFTDIIVKVGDLIADKARELFPGDPARQHEVTQVLANRAGSMLGLVGGLGAASWYRQHRRAKKAAAAVETGQCSTPVQAGERRPGSSSLDESRTRLPPYSAGGKRSANAMPWR